MVGAGGGRCLNQYMVGGRWLMVGGRWLMVGGLWSVAGRWFCTTPRKMLSSSSSVSTSSKSKWSFSFLSHRFLRYCDEEWRLARALQAVFGF